MKFRRIYSLLMCFVQFATLAGEQPKSVSSLAFKENKGQISDQFSKPRPDILFAGSSGDIDFYLRTNGISYQMYRLDSWKKIEDTKLSQERTYREVPDKITAYRLDINWLNVNTKAQLSKENPREGYENYYNAACPNGVSYVRAYQNVTYHDLYKGIDLKWYEKNGELKYDYLLAPGSDYKQIKLEIKGAESIVINKNGEITIKTPLGIINEKAPYVTQNGKILNSKWVLTKNVLSFEIEDIDVTKPLVIDPLVRLWGSYYGGSQDDFFSFSDVDANGNIYASGYTQSQNNIATTGAHQTTLIGAYGNALLVKFDPAGVRQWATYYGGDGEYAAQCAVNTNGSSVALVGVTSCTVPGVIATPGAHQTTKAALDDAFLVLFNDAGIRQWGTYHGSVGSEWGSGCDIDKNGNVYMCGTTTSSVGLSTPGSNQPAFAGGSRDGYIAKFNNTGALTWSTYYGGSKWDWLISCILNENDDLFITGYSESVENISTENVFQPDLVGAFGWGDAIIAKFNSSGVKQWATYYGGNGPDAAYNCVFDKTGNVYVSGTSSPQSQTLTTSGAHQEKFGGGSYDAFLLKLTPTGSRMWCTYYGGRYDEHNNWCSIDPQGNIYLMGCTNSSNNIASPCAYQQTNGGKIYPPSGPVMGGGWPPVGGDAYIAKFTQDGVRLWGTYFGGSGFEGGTAWEVNCTGGVDLSGNIFIVGTTHTKNGTAIASPNSHQPDFGGGKWDAFIAKFDGCFANATNATPPQDLKICFGDSTMVTASPTCVTWYDSVVGGNAIGGSATYTTTALTTATTFYVSDESCGPTLVRTAITVSVDPLPVISVNNPSVILCREPSVNLIATGATSYSWSPAVNISCEVCPDPVVSPTQRTEYCVMGTDNNSCVGKVCSIIEVYGEKGHNFSFPNAFTPNNDGINDVFCLKGWDTCNEDFLIMIFNRWGEKVYESADPNFCWDGVFNGQLLSSDVYIYSVKAKYKDNSEQNKKGNITLIR